MCRPAIVSGVTVAGKNLRMVCGIDARNLHNVLGKYLALSSSLHPDYCGRCSLFGLGGVVRVVC